MQGTPSAPTPINLAQHSYYNLNGAGDVRDHQIQIAASTYTPVDRTQIPTGEILPVKNTRFDFTQPTTFNMTDPDRIGVGRFLDNIFIERLWRSMKYECVYLHAWESGSEAKAGIKKWMDFYNNKRPHSALGGKPPAVVYWQRNETTKPDQQMQRVA